MSETSSVYVFNPEALAWSGLILFGILMFHAFYMFAVNRLYRMQAQALIDCRHYVAAQGFFLVGAFMLSAAHILEILILGYALKWMGLVSDIHQAIVFAGSTYTTVGFGSDPLPVGWDLVMVTMALSGLITVAWTTSVLFGMASYSHTAFELERQQSAARRLARS